MQGVEEQKLQQGQLLNKINMTEYQCNERHYIAVNTIKEHLLTNCTVIAWHYDGIYGLDTEKLPQP